MRSVHEGKGGKVYDLSALMMMKLYCKWKLLSELSGYYIENKIK